MSGYLISGVGTIKVDSIPAELKNRDHWVAWKAVARGEGKKPTKVPVNPATGGNAMSNDDSTWGSFDRAIQRATDNGLAGIGLMFNDDDLVGIDLDNVMEDGKFTDPLAEAVVRGLDTYTEISPSGKGVKMWVISSVHPSKCNGTIKILGESVDYETYNKGRWFAVTGHVLPQFGDGKIQERSSKFEKMQEMGAKPKAVSKVVPADLAIVPATGGKMDEEDMIRAALRLIGSDLEGTWFRMGCCLKSWGTSAGDERAKALWDEWANGSDKFDPSTQNDRWIRMVPDRGLTIGTIFSEAKAEGYVYGDALGADNQQYRIDNTPEWFKKKDARNNESKAELEAIGVKPVIELPNIGGWSRTTITDAADKIGQLMGHAQAVYYRGGVVVKIKNGESVEVSAAEMQSELERHATLVIAKTSPKGEIRTIATTATASQCQAVMASQPFLVQIPQIKTMTMCPVITGRKDGSLAVVTGYDQESGILATGGKVEEVSLADAVNYLTGYLSDFEFSSKGDGARAIAALITPALVQGGLLGGRSPIDLGEADDSQAGKGYRNRMVAAIYNAEVNTIAQRQGGSGSLEESFCRALMAGTSFLSIDNVRRKIDSPMIESALTEDYCDCRVPYRQPMQIDMRRVCVMMTTNGVELNRDLANRCSPVRIRKRPPGYAYTKYSEGDLIAHVKANQGRCLGSIFAVIKAWHTAGSPITDETRHDFRRWAGVLDWIVQNIFGAVPLCDGLLASKARMTNPHLSWLRELALAVLRKKMGGRPLRAYELVDIAEEAGIEPGGDPSTAPDPEKAANQMMGKKLGRAFTASQDGKTLFVDDTMFVERQSEADSEGRDRKFYVFRQGVGQPENEAEKGVPPDQGALGGSSGGKPQNGETDGENIFATGVENQIPPDKPRDRPVINPLIKPNVPVDPVMMDNTFSTMVISTPENGICNSIGEKNAPIRGSRGIKGENEAQISASDPSKDRFLLDEESEPVEEVVKSRAPRTWWWPEKPVWPSKLSSPPLEDDIRINPPALEFDLDDNGFADDGFAGKGLL